MAYETGVDAALTKFAADRPFFRDYLRHSALNAGQAARDVRYLFNHPDADAVAAEGSVAHKLQSLKHRLPSLGNNLLYTALPPQLHHTPESMADMDKATAKEWFLNGYAPWKHKIAGALAALDKFAAMTPAFLRTIARDGDIEIDHPEFKAKCKGLTGKEHLDDMGPSQLQQVAKMIWSKAAEEDDDENSKKLRAMFSPAGAAGFAAPYAANTVAYVAAHERPRSKKEDFSQPKKLDALRKSMEAKPAKMVPGAAAGMGVIKERPLLEPGKTKTDWGVVLPTGVSEATAAHELGHVKNWQAVENLIGKKPAQGLFHGLMNSQNASALTAGPLAALAATDEDKSYTPGLLQAGMSAPRLLDEGGASVRALAHLIRQHGLGSGLRQGASLFPAFGTYAALAATPLAITAARRAYEGRDK